MRRLGPRIHPLSKKSFFLDGLPVKLGDDGGGG
jgi:hypothetical protein